MYRAEFELETITPLFMRGADQSKAEFRSASVKGVMRWWFRALAGSYFGNNIRNLQKAECRVFGCAGSGETRRSSVIVQVDYSNATYGSRPLPMVWNKHTNKRVKKNAIVEGSSLTVILESPQLESLKIAAVSLIAMSYFGGLGFRNNRGAGSTAIRVVDAPEGIMPEEFLPSKLAGFKKLPKLLQNELKEGLAQLLRGGFPKRQSQNSSSCPQYSTIKENCFRIYLWNSRANLSDVYYKSDNLYDNDTNLNLLDEFEKEFKNKIKNKKKHISRHGYKDFIFGMANPRRSSPLKVGVVRLDGKYYLRLSVFKTEPYHPRRQNVDWNHLFGFLQNIRARQVYPNRS